MQYSKDFTNVNSIDKNLIPDNLQSQLGSGLIDNKILNYYDPKISSDINMFSNSTYIDGINNDLFKSQLNNENNAEQKYLIEYANKISHKNKMKIPNFSNQFSSSLINSKKNFSGKEASGERAILNIPNSGNFKEIPTDTLNLNFLESRKTESLKKNLNDYADGNKLYMINLIFRSTEIHKNARRSISKIF